MAFAVAHQLGSTRGFQEGIQAGRTEGRRAAKGLNPKPGKRGPPYQIDEGLIRLLIDCVNNRKKGTSVKNAVRYFLKAFSAGEKFLAQHGNDPGLGQLAPDGPFRLPTEDQAIRAYYRGARKLKGTFQSGDL